MFTGITLVETHGKESLKNEENTTYYMYISDYYKTLKLNKWFLCPTQCQGQRFAVLPHQLPAGVAMGGCVKHLFIELCHSSYIFFMAMKTEKTKASYALTSEPSYPKTSALCLGQCSPEEARHSLRYFSAPITCLCSAYKRLKKNSKPP